MTTLTIIASFMLAILMILTTFTALTYQQIMKINLLNGAYQADEYRKASAVQKSKQPTLPAVKQKVRGRNVSASEELVDLADLPWEEGYKILEEIGR